MSPVATELNESSQLIEQSMIDEPSIQTTGYLASGHCGMVAGLRDNVQSRFTIVRSFSALHQLYFKGLYCKSQKVRKLMKVGWENTLRWCPET